MHSLIPLTLLSSLAAAATPGLLWVTSRPTHPDLTDAAFNDWYSNEHIRDFVSAGIADRVLRYRNVNTTAPNRYLALYRLPDAAVLRDAATMAKVPATSQKLPGKEKGSKGGAYRDVLAMETRAYVRSQTFEGQIPKAGRGKGLVTSGMEPANGTDADFDAWYRNQHLDMLSMLSGYRRSTRYTKLDGSVPKYLAMHEFDTTALPADIRLVMGTEWAKKVVGSARVAGTDRWEFIAEAGKAADGEKF